MLISVEAEHLRGLELTEAQALVNFAVGLFTGGRVTLGRAAAIARLNQLEFQRELGRRNLELQYGLEDLRADLLTLAALRKP